MGSTPETPSLGREVDQRELWGVRIAALAGMFLIYILPVYVRSSGVLSSEAQQAAEHNGLFYLYVPGLRYLITLWRLRATTLKKGLAWAIGTCLWPFLFLLPLLDLLVENFPKPSWRVAVAGSVLFVLAQPALVGTAMRVRRPNPVG